MEITWSFLKKIESRTTIWSSSLTSGCISKRIKIQISKEYLYFSVHFIITDDSHNMEITQMAIKRWMDEENMEVYISGILFIKFSKWDIIYSIKIIS